jgi:hypothetical protein
LFGRSGRLLRRSRLILNRGVHFDHLANLPKDADRRGNQQRNGQPLPDIRPAITSLALFPKGPHLIGRRLDQDGEVRPWGVRRVRLTLASVMVGCL